MEPSSRRCPQCDHPNPAENRFCGACGTPLPIESLDVPVTAPEAAPTAQTVSTEAEPLPETTLSPGATPTPSATPDPAVSPPPPATPAPRPGRRGPQQSPRFLVACAVALVVLIVAVHSVLPSGL